MDKLKDRLLSDNFEERSKIGLTLIIFGIFIFVSVFLLFDASEPGEDDPEYTADLIARSGRFIGISLFFAGIVLLSIDFYKKFSKSKKS